MKRIGAFLVIMMMLLIFASSVLAADPCIDISGGKKCFFTMDTYNSTLPIIHIKFKEKPVFLNDYSLKSYNTSLPSELKIILDGSLLDANTEYSFQPKAHLPDGKYLFYMDSTDIDGNKMVLEVNFSIDAENMKIWVDEPKSIHLLEPEDKQSQNFAVGKTEEFNLQLELEREGDCVYALAEPDGNKTLREHYIDNENKGWNFTPTPSEPNKVRIQNFSLKKTMVLGSYPHNGDLEPLYVICSERNAERYTLKTIMVGSDGTPPVIVVNKDPHPVTDYTDPETNFSIQTSDLSVCTTKHINPKDGLEVKERITRPKGYDFSSPSDFVKQYDEIIILPTSQPQNDFKFNVTCTNMANRINSEVITVTSDMDMTQGVNLIYPTKPLNVNDFDINITVNFKNDKCEYSIDEKDGNYKDFTPTKKTDHGRLIYTAEASASHGKHIIYVKCEQLYNKIETFDLVIDVEDPPAPELFSEENTCSEKQIEFKINGTDDEEGTGLERFHYNITFTDEGYEDKYIYDTTSRGKEKVTVKEDLPSGLKDGSPIGIEVWAEDKAGNLGPSSFTTVYLSNSSIPECDFVKPDIIINKSQDEDTKEWTIYVGCEDNEGGSGCAQSYAYSTHLSANDNCTYENYGNAYTDPIFVTQTLKLCAIVYDNNNNNNSEDMIIEFDYPLHCFDEAKNSGETDVDCGGECAGCDIGLACHDDADCLDKFCAENNTCQLPSCDDTKENGFETDIDCGGINQGSGCSGCDIGQSCKEDEDCLENNCLDNVCSEATCDDMKYDGQETDVDCGGADCGPCPEGYNCVLDSDCETNYDCGPEGTCWLSRSLDSDGDGMPDWWEIAHGLDPHDYSDANEDDDGDRYTNLEEYAAGTDPRNAEDTPDFYKPNWLGLMLVIFGGIAFIVGLFLLLNEHIKKKKHEDEKEEKEFQSALAGSPRPISLSSPQVKPLKPTYSLRELKLREEQRQKTMKDRKNKRRDILNEFTTDKQEPNPKPKTPQNPVIKKQGAVPKQPVTPQKAVPETKQQPKTQTQAKTQLQSTQKKEKPKK